MSLRYASLVLLFPSLLCTAQWTPLATTGVTTTRSMTSAAGALYAATYPTGVKKSTDAGDNWSPVNTGLPQSGANYFVESVGYNGTYLFAGTQSGIYRSNDGGASWSSANGTLTASNTVNANKFYVFAGVTMAVFNGDILNGGGIWRTGNNGNTWTIGHSGMGSNAKVFNMAVNGATLYASTNVGLYTSSDNGLSWQPSASMNYACYGIAVNGNNLIALTAFGYRYSTNGGGVWTDATGDPASPVGGEIAVFDGKIYATVVTSGTTTSDVLVSTSNGASWVSASTAIGPIDITALNEFLVDGGLLYLGALFDIYFTTDLNVGFSEAIPDQDLRVMPTVFSDGFVVEGLDVSVPGRLELIDAYGRIVSVQAVNTTRVRVERGTINAGAYSVLLSDARGARVIARVFAE
jgi:hypothetical protein